MSEKYDKTIRWLTGLVPGKVARQEACVSIAHGGFNSTLWFRTNDTVLPPALLNLEFYQLFDGADLFGSAFKLCSILEPRVSGEVILVDTITRLAQELRRSGVDLPARAAPFMIGSGQCVYYTMPDDRLLHEYDLEQRVSAGTYTSLAAVIDEWAKNMHGGA